MKKFKIIDYWISIALLLFFIPFVALQKIQHFLIAYLITGTWQICSMLVHAYNGWCTKKDGARYYYHWLTIACVLLLPLGFFFILFYIAPIMALFYTALCYYEVHTKLQRPMDLLK
jgi:hypothetical protein